nr:MAG TPA: hypothetical protein [Caudoviricetes sp.]
MWACASTRWFLYDVGSNPTRLRRLRTSRHLPTFSLNVVLLDEDIKRSDTSHYVCDGSSSWLER